VTERRASIPVNGQGRSGSQISKGSSRLQRRTTIDVYKTDNLPSLESPEAANVSSMR